MQKTKIYRGRRDSKGRIRVTVNGRLLRHIRYHTDIFDWGTDNDGAADLALSILANYLGERPYVESKRFLVGEYTCWRLHQDFKAAKVVDLPQSELWSMTSEEIASWFELLPKEASYADIE